MVGNEIFRWGIDPPPQYLRLKRDCDGGAHQARAVPPRGLRSALGANQRCPQFCCESTDDQDQAWGGPDERSAIGHLLLPACAHQRAFGEHHKSSGRHPALPRPFASSDRNEKIARRWNKEATQLYDIFIKQRKTTYGKAKSKVSSTVYLTAAPGYQPFAQQRDEVICQPIHAAVLCSLCALRPWQH